MTCWLYCALAGTYLSLSTGRADANGIAIINRKSAAGCVSLICSVEELGAEIPEIVCVFWKLLMLVAVGLCALLAKYAVSWLSYFCSPAIPPFAVLGTTVAMSGAGLTVLFQLAEPTADGAAYGYASICRANARSSM